MTVLSVYGLKCQVIRRVDSERTRVYVQTTEGGVRVTLGDDKLKDVAGGQALIRVTVNDDPYRLPRGQAEVAVIGEKICFHVSSDQIIRP